MDPDGNILSYIILLLILIMINGFFAMSEMAIVSLNDNKIRRMAETGDKKAIKLLRFIDDPTNFLSTIQIGVTLSGALASAVAAETFVGMIVSRYATVLGIDPSLLGVISLILITVIISYLTLIIGEMVPKRIAMQHYERISFAIVGILSVFTVVISPFVKVISSSTNGVLRLIGIDPSQQPEEITEEEIRLMLDVGNESGHIHQSDKEMIVSIFEFDDRYVEDIMAHRTEIMAIEVGATLDQVYQVAVESGYSRIPVYEDDLDDIVGVLYVKDLLQFARDKEENFDINKFLRPPLYTIETTTCKALLGLFQETKIQMAIVVDEYGGTAGLVSMEDLLESIVGNIQDEYDDEEEDITQLSENVFIVDGLTPLEKAFSFFGMGIPGDDDDFDTIGGYVLSRIGQIPDEHDRPEIIVKLVKLTVEEMDEKRIAKLRIEKLPPESETESDDNEPTSLKLRQKESSKDKKNPQDA